jgi:hypothetical protein
MKLIEGGYLCAKLRRWPPSFFLSRARTVRFTARAPDVFSLVPTLESAYGY